ncbi:MAG: hypothetical protein V4539_24145 [Bacteroidota bacterium]
MNNKKKISQSVKRNYVLLLLMVGCLFMPAAKIYSQVAVTAYKGTDCVFNTLADINAGCTSTNYLTVQYSGFTNGVTYPAGWTLKVKANGSFSNGSSTILPQYVSLAFNSAPSGPSGVTGNGYHALSTVTAASLYTTSASLQTPPIYFFEHKLDMKIQGGSHLAIGTGTYSTTLTITLVDKNGVTLATKNDVAVSFVVNYTNSCNTATIASYSSNQYTFSTYAQQMAGATITDANTVQYNPNSATCSGWSLKVRAAGNFTSGANSIAPQYFSLRFNRVSSGSPSASAIGVTNTPVVLSTSDVTLINQSNAGFVAGTGTEHKFDMIIQGGNHLLLPNGTYTGNLVFTLYNQSNQVVSTTTVSQSFAINSSVNSYSIVFQNSADNINLAFNTIANYINGVSVTKTNGLKITGYNPYQVIIKTSSPNLSSASGATIPVSVVSLQTTKSTSTSAGINVYTRQLSATDQIIITNPLVDFTQQVVQFNLRYYTTAGDKRLSGPSGTFNTSVLFVVIPQ